MEKISSVLQIQKLVSQIREKQNGFLTNFYLDKEKHQIWIENGDLFFEEWSNSVFLIKKSDDFWNVFYNSTNLIDLSTDLKGFSARYRENKLLFDIVGREKQCTELVSVFGQNGYCEATSLVRMTRLVTPMMYLPDNRVEKAAMTDIPEIYAALHLYFDAQTEQIPYRQELEKYAERGRILLCREQNNLAGFVIFELNASTSYLRYWFTHPDYRDRKIGSALLRRFFEEGKNTKRQLFWVIRSNENAIRRYRHYGFSEEDMFDIIMENQ